MTSTQRRKDAETSRPHSIVRLEDDLLVVFKPRAHEQAVHSHPYGQTLRVLRGRLIVTIGAHEQELTPTSAPLDIQADLEHATLATEPTWLVVERFG